jgi:sugar phosphate isomerase/epimerase
MYLSCSCLVCDRKRFPALDETLAKIRELGFAAVDLDLFENWQHVNPSELAAGGEPHVAQVADVVRTSGLRVSSLNCGPSQKLNDPSPQAFEQYQREFAALIALAEAVECANVTLQAGPLMGGRDSAEQRDTMREHVRELAALRGERDITISLEGHANTLIEEPGAALEFMQSVWPDVGYTYDPSHPELQGTPLRDTEALLRYTHHVHVRNASLGKMQDTMTAGTVDIEWVVTALKEVGYNGAITIEYFGGFDADFANTMALRGRLIELGVRRGP